MSREMNRKTAAKRREERRERRRRRQEKEGNETERNRTRCTRGAQELWPHVAREHNAFQVAAMIASQPANWLVSTFAKQRTGSYGRKYYLCTPNFNQTELAPLVARRSVNERSIGRSFR